MNKLQKLSKELPFVIQLEKLKDKVDSHRPFSKEFVNKIFQKLRLDWNYNSNAIEGNSLTRGETVSLLMEGITAKGKPLKDALDIKGHNEAIDFMLNLIKDERNLTEADIRALHKLVLGEDFFNKAETSEGKTTRKIIKSGQYKTQPNHVKTSTGEIHYYASPEETPSKMKELVEWYNENSKTKDVNPVVLASIFHHKFVEIHPFDDGNGRMTRLLTNFILMKFGYPVSVIKKENRNEYYSVLSRADNGEIIPIIQLISNTVKNSLGIMVKAINGESIADVDDLDKEIELFVKGFDRDNFLIEEKSEGGVVKLFKDFLIPFIDKLVLHSKNFDSLFHKNVKQIRFSQRNEFLSLKKSKLKLGLDNDVDDEGDLSFITTSEYYKEIINQEEDINGLGEYIIDIDLMELNLNWKAFLKNQNQNNLYVEIIFVFKEFKYEIKVNSSQEIYFSNYYHKIPSNQEIDFLIKKIYKEQVMERISDWK